MGAMRKLRVYVAGPLTQGDPEANTQAAWLVADRLIELGFTPFCPHLTFYADRIKSRPYDFWLAYDFEWVKACDCVLRMPGFSPGAEREVAFAGTLGIPVFHSVEELERWASVMDEVLE